MKEIRKTQQSLRILAAARNAWNAGADFRARRLRAKRFTYGDQWSDITRDRWGDVLSEADLARKNGRTPMTNNLIRRLVKCVVGHFRNRLADETRDPAIATIHDANSLDELDSRALEEFLISGCVVQQVVAERRAAGTGVWVDNVRPDRFFVNSTTDPRGWDIEIIGRLHDMSFPEVVMRFSQGDRQRIEALRRIFAEPALTPADEIFGRDSDGEFFHAPDSRCRVIEVWTLEAAESIRCHDRMNGKFSIVAPDKLPAIDVENLRRVNESLPQIEYNSEFTTSWHCRWLAPDGSILGENGSPNLDGSHPFSVKLYPLTDGEIHSLVEDVIDQQIYVNRLITMINHIMSCSAKGALLFPVGCEVEPGSLTNIAHMWSSPDAVIPYRPLRDGSKPQQVGGNVTDIGARELLALEIQMFEDVSGVSNALMGKSTGGGNVGYERYESEVRNALVSIADLLDTFNHFRACRDNLIAKTK